MFFSCFKCKDNDDLEDYRQRPRTRNPLTNIPKNTKTSTNPLSELVAEDAVDEAPKSINELQQEILKAHNDYRSKHGCPPLVLNRHLNSLATEWAKYLANSNTLQHRKNNKYGENLYMSTGLGSKTIELAVKSWYDEVKNYNFNRPGFSPNTGHFTQVVWKTSKELGVGIATKGNRTWVVCNYDPPGNIMGNFLDCVPSGIEEKLTRIVSRMKSKRKFLDWKNYADESKDTALPEKTETLTDDASLTNSDLNIFTKFELECLDMHNQYRALHGVPAMKLNRELCNMAKEWSHHLARSRSISHRPNNQYGENIYYASNFLPTAKQCVQSWYDEIKNYKFSKPGFSSNTGHFTQVVWRDSQELGVGVTTLDKTTYLVCNYSPAGNVMGEYEDQVLPPDTTRKGMDISKKPIKFAKDKEPEKSTFEEVCLDSHNSYRAMHGSPPLTLNSNLNFFANDWAQRLASEKQITFRKNNRFGENIFLNTGPSISGRDPVDFWYSAIRHYNFESNNFTAETNSFTQVIWKNTKQLGVAVAKVGQCSYVVCNYRPKGNIREDFKENVLPLSSADGSYSETLPSTNTNSATMCKGKHLPPHQVDIFTVNMWRFHNIYRSRHGCPELKLSNELMVYSWRCGSSLNQNKTFPGIPIYVISVCNLLKDRPVAEEIVDSWYSEIERYDFKNPQFTSETRHFTQLVWKSTKFMGVGLIESDNQTMVVVSYEPAGNIEGLYAENVPEPI